MERTLRDAIAQYASTWNQRDIDAWATLLSNDIVNVGEYGFERRTRIAVVTYNKTVISNFDLRVQVLRLRIASDGRDATAILRLHHLGLPVQSGRYAISFDRAPVVSRWRLEEGVWRLYYLNENLKQAADIVQAEQLD